MNLLRYADCLRLNLRVLALALARRWIGRRDFAASYDRLSPKYDEAWQLFLRPVTDRLLAQLPPQVAGRVLDLGCGTGYTSLWLAGRYKEAHIVAIDLSTGMLDVAKGKGPAAGIQFIQADLLDYLRQQEAQSAAGIVSAWAIGYSHPAQVIAEAGRVLKPGGWFALVVNRADTLRPVYLAFRKCMARYSGCLTHLAWPTFPKSLDQLRPAMAAAGFSIRWEEEGQHEIRPPVAPGAPLLPWLLQTGILAGFEHMLPLREPGPVSDYFEELMRQNREPICHRYLAVLLEKA